MDQQIYLDYLATTPICREASEAMIHLLQNQNNPEGCWGNPGSEHHVFGRCAKEMLELARGRVARLINCKPTEICFESGSTETINHAIRGVLHTRSSERQHVVLSEIEHPAVMETVLDATKGNRTIISPNKFGLIEPTAVKAACIKGKTALVTIMLVNNELGSINDIKEIVETVKEVDPDILVHTDASQAVGKIDVDVIDLGVDLLTIAGHKLYGPKGIGALFIKEGLSIKSLVTGAGHELARRAGTENVLLAVGLGEACEAASKHCLQKQKSTRELRNELLCKLSQPFDEGFVRLNGPEEEKDRLPGALSISIGGGLRGNDIAIRCANLGVAFSAGAACHSGEVKPSKVLKAVGMPDTAAVGTIRLCVGRYTEKKDIDAASKVIVKVIQDLLGKDHSCECG